MLFSASACGTLLSATILHDCLSDGIQDSGFRRRARSRIVSECGRGFCNFRHWLSVKSLDKYRPTHANRERNGCH